jgi:DNA-binding response OmpR family regulator
MRALIVEDDVDIARDIAANLADAGFLIETAADGATASVQGNDEDYDLVVLDLGLPRLDGMSVLRGWRTNGRAFPVIILSARGDWTEKVEGIEAGADDYLAKPFQMGELTARARALVRRAAGRVSPVIRLGKLALDTRRMQAIVNGAQVRISSLEYRLLDYLAHHAGRVVSAGELAEHLYGVSEANDTNAIEAIVSRLRRKLGAEIIMTQRGFGYLLEPAAS